MLYECKTCKARGGLKTELKHTGACASSTTSIGSPVDHVCTKSGKYPHVSRDAK